MAVIKKISELEQLDALTSSSNIIIEENGVAKRIPASNINTGSGEGGVVENYVLPVATADTLGGVKSGGDVTVNEDGTMSVVGGNVDGSVSDEQIAQAVEDYMAENPVEVGDVVKSVNGVTPDENGNVVIEVGSDSESYTLPIANSTTLGGVKAQAKTAAMTQPVGVDDNGNLYTLPPAQSTTEVGGVSFDNYTGNLWSGVVYGNIPNVGDHVSAGTGQGRNCTVIRAKPNTSYVVTAASNISSGLWGQADGAGICTQTPVSLGGDGCSVEFNTPKFVANGGLGKYMCIQTNANLRPDTVYLVWCGTPTTDCIIYEGDSIEGYDTIGAYSPLNGVSTSDGLLVQRRNLSEDVHESLRNADTAVQPEDFGAETLKYFDTYNDGIVGIAATGSPHPVGYSAHATIRELMNTAEVSAQFLRNQIRLDLEGRYAHCPEVVVIGDTAYIAAFMNTEGGDRYDVATAKTMLYVVDIPTMTQTGEHVVAENGSVVGDLTFPLGSGACTCVILGNIIRVNFVAKLSDDQWHQLYRDYNPADDTWGDIGFCKILDDGVEYDFTTANVSAHIQEIPGSVADDGLTINTNIVGQHTVINGVYYVGVGARDQWTNMPILKTTDWIAFEHFATPTVEGNDAHFEMAVASNGVDTLYTATRQKSADKLVLMKINATTGTVTTSAEIVNGNHSRPYIYKSGEWLYVAHILTKNRANSSQITVLRANNLEFMRCLTLPPMVYPAFAPCNEGVFAAYMVPWRLCATKFTAFEPYETLDAVSAFAHLLRMTQK